MYYLMIWNKELASSGYDGCLDKVEISLDIAYFFFDLDVENFPILSSLSLDDYDIFSASQIDLITAELLAASCINQKILSLVKSLEKLLLQAKALGLNVMFDPFRG